jgi:hypothetical protein
MHAVVIKQLTWLAVFPHSLPLALNTVSSVSRKCSHLKGSIIRRSNWNFLLGRRKIRIWIPGHGSTAIKQNLKKVNSAPIKFPSGLKVQK